MALAIPSRADIKKLKYFSELACFRACAIPEGGALTSFGSQAR